MKIPLFKSNCPSSVNEVVDTYAESTWKEILNKSGSIDFEIYTFFSRAKTEEFLKIAAIILS